jgi:hypothetical protein
LDTPASIEITKQTLLSAGIGTVAGVFTQKVTIPDVAVFPIVGTMIGPQALGLVDIKADSALNQIILLFGASYVLFDGAASLRFNVLKQTWILGARHRRRRDDCRRHAVGRQPSKINSAFVLTIQVRYRPQIRLSGGKSEQ